MTIQVGDATRNAIANAIESTWGTSPVPVILPSGTRCVAARVDGRIGVSASKAGRLPTRSGPGGRLKCRAG